jgi:hypothetical protein
VLSEDVIDHGVNTVENRVPHGRGRVSHYAKGLEMALVRVVHQRNGDVQQVVQIAIQLLVGAQVGGLDHVAQNVDSILLRQSKRSTIWLEKKKLLF